VVFTFQIEKSEENKKKYDLVLNTTFTGTSWQGRGRFLPVRHAPLGFSVFGWLSVDGMPATLGAVRKHGNGAGRAKQSTGAARRQAANLSSPPLQSIRCHEVEVTLFKALPAGFIHCAPPGSCSLWRARSLAAGGGGGMLAETGETLHTAASRGEFNPALVLVRDAAGTGAGAGLASRHWTDTIFTSLSLHS
jgi:hypothetical protein